MTPLPQESSGVAAMRPLWSLGAGEWVSAEGHWVFQRFSDPADPPRWAAFLVDPVTGSCRDLFCSVQPSLRAAVRLAERFDARAGGDTTRPRRVTA